ncbi:MAG: 3-deoxy-D-manno-octulosonic acid transferase [Pseudomonadota bacterium]
MTADTPDIPFGLRLYQAVSGVSGPVARYALRARLKRGKEDASRLGERMGEAGRPRPDGPLIWIHGASVGESLSVLPLVQRIAHIRPQATVLVTTGTITSAELMAERLPANALHQFIPVDHPGYVDRFLAHWRPDAALFVESEFWPNLILRTKQAGTPLALVNGRISPKTYENWKKRPRTIRALLSAFDVLIAQDQVNADRLHELSGADVSVFGNLKLAADPLPAPRDLMQDMQRAVGARLLWLAASTHPGEEEIALDAHKELRAAHPELLLLLAPRHPVRGDEVATLIAEKGLSYARRSHGALPGPETAVYLADTLGELGVYYRLADIAFVGGSVAEKGGHNPLEPARLHTSILHGPHTFNFAEIYNDLRMAGGAALVRNDRDLVMAIGRLLGDAKTRASMANVAETSAEASAVKVLDEVVARLEAMLPLAGAPVPETP